MAARVLIQNFSDKYSKQFKLAHVNAQSLANDVHFAEFQDIFQTADIDIIIVTETFLKKSIRDESVALNGYIIIRNDREGAQCGGVAVYVKEKYASQVIQISDNVYRGAPKPEYILMQLKWYDVSILITGVYRPPKSSQSSLDTLLDDMYNYIFNYDYVFMLGDINGRFGCDTFESNSIINFLSNLNLTKINFLPTFHCTYADTNLDLLASNCPELILKYGQIPVPGLSGHDMIFAAFDIATPAYKPKLITYRDFKLFNADNFRNYVANQRWHDLVKLNSADEKVNLFEKLLLEVYDTHVPLKTVKSMHKPTPWMTNEIRLMIENRDKLYTNYAKYKKKELFAKAEEVWNLFKKARNKVKQTIRNSKKRHLYSLFSGAKSNKILWNEVKKMGMMKSVCKNEELVVTANELNEHYVNVARTSDFLTTANAIRYYNNQSVNVKDVFDFKYVSPLDIKKAIATITSQATGFDNVSIATVKLCGDVLVPAIEHIFNYCLQNSVFPSRWKLAVIKPIAKIGRPTICKDYRPVSILSVLANFF